MLDIKKHYFVSKMYNLLYENPDMSLFQVYMKAYIEGPRVKLPELLWYKPVFMSCKVWDRTLSLSDRSRILSELRDVFINMDNTPFWKMAWYKLKEWWNYRKFNAYVY